MPTLSTEELKRYLRANGCALTDQGAKHEKWRSEGTGKTFVVPRDLKGEGTLRGILKSAGLPHPKHARRR